MKNLPLSRKYRQPQWLVNFIALSLLLQSAALRVHADGPFPYLCQGLMEKISPSQKEAANKEKKIIKLKQGIRAQPFDFQEYSKLVEYYKANPEKLDDWLQDLTFRLDRGATTWSEEFAAAALTSDKAYDDMEVNRKTQNFTVKTIPFYSFNIFDIHKTQATASRQWMISKIPTRLVNLARGRRYTRSYKIITPRSIPERGSDELSLFPKTNLNFPQYLDSLTNAIHVVKNGQDPKYFIRNFSRTKAAILAAGPEFFQAGLTNLFYSENKFNFEPFRKIIREFVVRAYPSSLEIGNTLDEIAADIKDPSRLETHQLNLDSNERTLLNGTDPVQFLAQQIDRKGRQEVTNSLRRFFAGFIVSVIFVNRLIKYFFAGGAGALFNGKDQDENNAACSPTSTDDENVMIELPDKNFSPFDPEFISPRLNSTQLGQPNPCDPDGHIYQFYTQKLQELNNNQDAFNHWEGANKPELAHLRDLIRQQYKYTGQNYSACAKYYGWYMRCGPGFNNN